MLIRDIISALSPFINIVVVCNDEEVFFGKRCELEGSIWDEASIYMVTAEGDLLKIVV